MFDINVMQAAKQNTNFRAVLFTGEHTQLVVMSLKVSEDIGSEVHHKNDQILLIVAGEAKIDIDDKQAFVKSGEITVVPAGARHNVTNTGGEDLKLITIYGPPDHKPGTVHATKSDALKDEGPAEQ